MKQRPALTVNMPWTTFRRGRLTSRYMRKAMSLSLIHIWLTCIIFGQIDLYGSRRASRRNPLGIKFPPVQFKCNFAR